MTALVALAMLADLATFWAVVPLVGIGAELNPVMAQGYSLGGILVVAALKLAGLAAIVLIVARVRRPRLRYLAAAIAIVVGVTGAASNVGAWVATPRPAAHVDQSPLLPGDDFARRTGTSDSHPGAQPAVPGRIAHTLSAVAASGPMPTGSPRTAPILRGTATTYGPGWDGWLALPQGPGVRVRICGAGGCVVRTSTDAGPSLAMQRQGRIADLDVTTFEAVCGVPWTRGLCRVTVTPIPAPPATATVP